VKLYMHPASITSRIVRLYAAEKGIALQEEVVDLFTGAHHQEPFVSYNPNRLVPVLQDGDFRLTESSAILIYLAEKLDHPEYPSDLQGRARVNEIIAWASFNFYRDWGYNLCYPQIFPHHKRPTDEGHRVAIEWGRDKSAFWLGVLNDHWLGHGRAWITGERMTVADYYVGGLVALGDLVRFDFSKYPNVAAWLGRVQALPNWKPVSVALDGYAASLQEQEFVTA
jgi:glutathione S-transferase